MLRVLSMGWGLQTWCLAAMAAEGLFARPHLIIFADAGHDREETYAFRDAWAPWLEERGIPHRTVWSDRAPVVRVNTSTGVLIPAYTADPVTGARGQLHRHCTPEWKSQPVRKAVREELAARGMKPDLGAVELWLGITLDEARRCRRSDVRYVRHRYPLIERRMTRSDCIRWLQEKRLPLAPRSSCCFCPLQSTHAWREMKRHRGPDWDYAVQVDAQIRNARRESGGQLFVHPGLKPLPEAVRIEEDLGYEPIPLLGSEPSPLHHHPAVPGRSR